MNYQTINKISLVREKSQVERTKICGSYTAAEVARAFYDDSISIFESFYVLLLDRGNKVTGYSLISQGGISGTVVDVKLIAKYALEALASGVILVHNHPSGTLTASPEDVRVTEKVRKGLSLLDIQTLDHLILTDENYLSLADDGLM